MRTKVKLGSTYITSNASATLVPTDVITAIRRHAAGDWGDLCEEDRAENEVSLKRHSRLFSIYHDSNGTKFWIITEGDRSRTTVLLPEDY